MFAQTGEALYQTTSRLHRSELAECQSAHGDGYVGGFTRKRGDINEDGKAIFPEIVKGDIRSAPFNLNGAWSPLYTLHKLLAGLLDADDANALKVAIGLARYFNTVFAKLSEEQMQKMLACEYGGLNESFMQLYERTNDARWLATAKRIYDHKVLDPLTQQHDELDGLHSNTQVPKIIGIARLHEATGDAGYRHSRTVLLANRHPEPLVCDRRQCRPGKLRIAAVPVHDGPDVRGLQHLQHVEAHAPPVSVAAGRRLLRLLRARSPESHPGATRSRIPGCSRT